MALRLAQKTNVASAFKIRIQKGNKRALEQLEFLRAAVADIEERMELTTPWTETMPEYLKITEKMKVRDYQKCLDKLESLVVSRLMELAKIGLVNTGIVIFCPSRLLY